MAVRNVDNSMESRGERDKQILESIHKERSKLIDIIAKSQERLEVLDSHLKIMNGSSKEA